MNRADARDPMIGFMRSYFKETYLVAGHLQINGDGPVLAQRSKCGPISTSCQSGYDQIGRAYPVEIALLVRQL